MNESLDRVLTTIVLLAVFIAGMFFGIGAYTQQVGALIGAIPLLLVAGAVAWAGTR